MSRQEPQRILPDEQVIKDMEEAQYWEAYHQARELKTNIITQDEDNNVDIAEFTLDLADYSGYGVSEKETCCILLTGNNTITITTPYETIKSLWGLTRHKHGKDIR